MSDRNTAAGNRLNQIIFLGSDGFPTGKTFTRPVAGSSTNGAMLRLYGAKEAALSYQGGQPVVVTAEDGFLRHEYDFPSDATRGFEIQLAELDLRTAMQVQNMPVKTYAGGQMGYTDVQDVLIPSVAAIFQSWAIDSLSGVKKWSGDIVLSGTLRFLGRNGYSERTGALYRYFLTPQPSAYDSPGHTIFDNDGAAKPTVYMPFRDYNYPLTMHAYTGNAVATVFPTELQPVSTTPTSDATYAATERVNQAITSIQTTTPYGVTFTAAPSLNGRGLLLYQFRA